MAWKCLNWEFIVHFKTKFGGKHVYWDTSIWSFELLGALITYGTSYLVLNIEENIWIGILNNKSNLEDNFWIQTKKENSLIYFISKSNSCCITKSKLTNTQVTQEKGYTKRKNHKTTTLNFWSTIDQSLTYFYGSLQVFFIFIHHLNHIVSMSKGP